MFDEAYSNRKIEMIVPGHMADFGLPAMVWMDGTPLSRDEIADEIDRDAWERKAFFAVNTEQHKAEVQSMKEYYDEFGLAAPKVPTVDHPEQRLHRERDHPEWVRSGGYNTSEEDILHSMGMVALPLKPQEWKRIPDAVKAVMSEKQKLEDKGAWGTPKVMEWEEVVRLARRKRKES